MSVSEYEYNKIVEALGHAERNAHPLNKAEWRRILSRFQEELEPTQSGICRCEDRPCCSCDGDVYQPAGSVYDRNDPNNYDPEEHFARMEQDEMESDEDEGKFCSICRFYFDDDTNEDDVVQGFHADCASEGDHYGDE